MENLIRGYCCMENLRAVGLCWAGLGGGPFGLLLCFFAVGVFVDLSRRWIFLTLSHYCVAPLGLLLCFLAFGVFVDLGNRGILLTLTHR